MSKVDKLPVGWRTGELFSENFEYIVPMYQRDFAWGEKEIKTLFRIRKLQKSKARKNLAKNSEVPTD